MIDGGSGVPGSGGDPGAEAPGASIPPPLAADAPIAPPLAADAPNPPPPPGASPADQPAPGPGDAGLPPPPPGPGVRVPFISPPEEHDRRRLWIALGIVGGLLGLCCVGGVLGVGTLAVRTGNDLRHQAIAVVDQYLWDLHESDYTSAFDQYCAAMQAGSSFAEFETTEQRQTAVSSYNLDDPRPAGSAIWVRAEVVRENGRQETPDFKLVQEGSSATSLKICQITQ